MSKYYPGISNLMPTDVKGRKVERSYTAHIKISAEKAIAADIDGIHEAVNGTAQEITTNITNPLVPRNITATAGGTASAVKAISVVIEGTNYKDEVITETLPAFTVDTTGTVEGNKAFKTITKITIPAHDTSGATTSIGFGDKLGLPYKLEHNTLLFAFLNNVKEETAPTLTMSANNIENNTMKLNSALNGSQVDAYLLV